MVYVLFTITIITHHHCSLILTVIPKPVRRFRLLYLVHRAGENRETEPPPLCKKKPVLITR